jgi:hypothetical protein
MPLVGGAWPAHAATVPACVAGRHAEPGAALHASPFRHGAVQMPQTQLKPALQSRSASQVLSQFVWLSLWGSEPGGSQPAIEAVIAKPANNLGKWRWFMFVLPHP